MSEELKRLLERKIEQQEKIRNLLGIQNFLNRMGELLEGCSSYEEFLKEKLVMDLDEGDDTSDTYIAVKELTKAILKESCHSKAGAKYVLNALKEMLYGLSKEIQISGVYEILDEK